MSSVSNTAKEVAEDLRNAAHESGKAAAAASGDIERDLQALRDDIGRLAQKVADIVASKGNSAWQRAKSSIDGVVSDAEAKGRETAGAVHDVSDTIVKAIDESIEQRPYTTLAIAAGLGFLFGAIWRR
jgi:ElaB/YqjD/DUF883 family membrane-anchored ribosome-binding protein